MRCISAIVLGALLLVSDPRRCAADPRKHRLAQQVAAWLATSGTPSAAVALIEDGRVRWTLVVGEQSPGTAATTATLYNVASLTKPITAETVLRELSADAVALDEPLSTYWTDPDLAADPRSTALTPRLCLSHQCGLPNWRSDTGGVLALLWKPGSRAAYSGEGYDYVARYLEARTSTAFPALAQRRVFGPLHMTSTAFTEQAWFEGRIAVPRGPEGKDGEPAHRTTWSAADDVYTTIGDYGSFVASVLRRERLSRAIAERRWQIDHDVSAEVCQPGRLQGTDCPRRMGFALGWVRFDGRRDTIFFQGGGDWGERTFALFVPRRKLGIVVLTNGANGMSVIRNVIATLYPDSAMIAFLTMQAGGGS